MRQSAEQPGLGLQPMRQSAEQPGLGLQPMRQSAEQLVEQPEQPGLWL